MPHIFIINKTKTKTSNNSMPIIHSMNKIETAVVAVLGVGAVVLAALFLPVFFAVLFSLGLIWFFIARTAGYRTLSYLALFIGSLLLIFSYPFNQVSGSIKAEVKVIALDAGVISGKKQVIFKKLDGEGKDAVFLVTNPDLKKATLVRPSTKSFKNYSISALNRQLKENKYSPKDIDSPQNKVMLAEFKDSFPLKYGIAFVFFLLPLMVVSSLPSCKKEGKRFVFDSSDGHFSSWLLPSGPSQDATGSVGAAGTQLVLALAFAMAIAFCLSMPSFSYLF